MMITLIDDFFSKGCGRCERFDTPDCSTRQWHDGLVALRQVCRAAGLTETVKWGHPCYMHANRNIVIIGAFRHDFRLSFFSAALMQDPEGVLEKQGANTHHADMLRFTANDQVAAIQPILTRYLKEAMAYAEQGLKPQKTDQAIELPDELSDTLAADLELAEAFYRLTPGRQKSYVIHLNSARHSATRLDRIARCRDKIIAGKGAMER